jgi:hypothetical protein
MIESFIVIVAEAGPRTAAMWLAASLVANAGLAMLLLYGAWRGRRG